MQCVCVFLFNFFLSLFIFSYFDTIFMMMMIFFCIYFVEMLINFVILGKYIYAICIHIEIYARIKNLFSVKWFQPRTKKETQNDDDDDDLYSLVNRYESRWILFQTDEWCVFYYFYYSLSTLANFAFLSDLLLNMSMGMILLFLSLAVAVAVAISFFVFCFNSFFSAILHNNFKQKTMINTFLFIILFCIQTKNGKISPKYLCCFSVDFSCVTKDKAKKQKCKPIRDWSKLWWNGRTILLELITAMRTKMYNRIMCAKPSPLLVDKYSNLPTAKLFQ